MTAISSAGKFAHLHVASSYSLRYGVASPAALVDRAAELGMPALALTDRDGLYGVIKHAVACTEKEVKPILGADMALCEDDRAPGRQSAAWALSPGGPARLLDPGSPGRPQDSGGPGRPLDSERLELLNPGPEQLLSQGGPARLLSSGAQRLLRSGAPKRLLRSGAPKRLLSSGAPEWLSAGEPARLLSPQAPARLLSPQAPARLRNESAARVTLLVTGRRGWASLCRLVSAAHQAGERGAPVVTPDMVAAHGEGLIALLGPGSDVGRAIAARRPDLAVAALARWRERAEVVIEIVDHQTAGATFRAARMLQLARDAGVPAVLTNAVRYLEPEDGPVAQVLDAARQLVPLGQRPAHFAGGRAHLATSTEMAEIADRICHVGQGTGEAEELLATTSRLAQRCSLDPKRDLGIGGRFLPESVSEPLALLRARCEEGLDRRFPRSGGSGISWGGGAGGVAGGGAGVGDAGVAGAGVAGGVPSVPSGGRSIARSHRAAARRRLDHELDIIAETGLASYFLTVADVADLIKGQGIRCSIRGSGAGCLVNYLIGISSIDPLEHDLIMERFLSERRKGLPDIDLDVESARRIEAYRVIVGTYSEQRVACVSMMETYRARSAIRDVTAALGLPPHEIDAIAKAFPHIRAAHIRGALAGLPELRTSGLAIPQLARAFQLAERLDGLPRHVAMHPCGVVLSNTTLLDRTAVERSIEGLPLSQFDKDDVETAGMIKLDVLGVRMQSAMAYALTEIDRTTGERVDIDEIDHHDEPTFEMIRSARTLGCFQIESPGQRELVAKLLPRDLGDLIVDISLFRPGPVNSDMVTPYLEIRHNQRPPCFPDVSLKEALSETGGVVVFHEQVLRIIDIMTGCGLSHAELIRRALSEEQYRLQIAKWFREKALERSYDSAVVDRVWEVLAAFGAFGFCKAHAAAFAIPTYQSSWLKRHYPAAFYAGVLTHDPGMYPKRVIVGDARLLGIRVLPVDINSCAGDWRVERAGQPPAEGLRPGLREIKGISDAEVAQIVAGQPYESLRDFWERAHVSRPITERLVLVGAFDLLYNPNPEPGGVPPVSRRDLLARVGVLDRSSVSRHFTRSVTTNHAKPDTKMTGGRERTPRQLLLDLDVGGDGYAELVPAGELRGLTATERVEAELEILGIDLSQHVLAFYEDLLAELGVVRSVHLRRCQAGSQVLVAGVKVATQTPAIRSGQRIIFATLDDATGPVDLAFFESVQDRCAARVFGSWLLAVRGRLRRVGQSVSVNGAECWDLAALAEIRAARGMSAVRAAMKAGDVPGNGSAAAGVAGQPGAATGGPPNVIYPNGFALSPFAETGPPGGGMKDPPRVLWHASPGSSGGWSESQRSRLA
jgi:error-prone DNA polymerase